LGEDLERCNCLIGTGRGEHEKPEKKIVASRIDAQQQRGRSQCKRPASKRKVVGRGGTGLITFDLGVVPVRGEWSGRGGLGKSRYLPAGGNCERGVGGMGHVA